MVTTGEWISHRQVSKLEETDFRQINPKFSEENLAINQQCLEKISRIATELNLSNAQLSLAWLLSQGDDIFPIPGTRKAARIDENLLSASVSLERAVIDRIDEITRPGSFSGGTLL